MRSSFNLEELEPLVDQEEAESVLEGLDRLLQLVGRGSVLGVVLRQARSEVLSLTEQDSLVTSCAPDT